MDNGYIPAVIKSAEVINGRLVVITFQPAESYAFDAETLKAVALDCHLPALTEDVSDQD